RERVRSDSRARSRRVPCEDRRLRREPRRAGPRGYRRARRIGRSDSDRGCARGFLERRGRARRRVGRGRCARNRRDEGGRRRAIGSLLWSKSFGNKYSQMGSAIAADTSGNVFLAGAMTGAVDFGGGPIYKFPPDAGLDQSQDMFLAKFDGNGRHLWSKRFITPG